MCSWDTRARGDEGEASRGQASRARGTLGVWRAHAIVRSSSCGDPESLSCNPKPQSSETKPFLGSCQQTRWAAEPHLNSSMAWFTQVQVPGRAFDQEGLVCPIRGAASALCRWPSVRCAPQVAFQIRKARSWALRTADLSTRSADVGCQVVEFLGKEPRSPGFHVAVSPLLYVTGSNVHI